MEEDILTLPEARIAEDVMTIPGTDGQKMSKSYQNILDIFLPEKELKKNVNAIITDSTPLEEPKDPDTCTVFKLYSLMATPEQTQALRSQYLGGNFGYGHAKKEFLDLLLTKFEQERERFDFFMNHPEEIEARLLAGEAKARQVALPLLNRVREKLGFL
jgi:tryptophanyl-tRNA synthetase